MLFWAAIRGGRHVLDRIRRLWLQRGDVFVGRRVSRARGRGRGLFGWGFGRGSVRFSVRRVCCGIVQLFSMCGGGVVEVDEIFCLGVWSVNQCRCRLCKIWLSGMKIETKAEADFLLSGGGRFDRDIHSLFDEIRKRLTILFVQSPIAHDALRRILVLLRFLLFW